MEGKSLRQCLLYKSLGTCLALGQVPQMAGLIWREAPRTTVYYLRGMSKPTRHTQYVWRVQPPGKLLIL